MLISEQESADAPAAPIVAPPPAVRDELLRHLDSAYNVARWLCRNEHDAQDIVQEAMLRAFRYGGQCRPDNLRAWLLQIVRNTCHTWRTRGRRTSAQADMLDDAPAPESLSPEMFVQRRQDAVAVREAIERLPDEFREVIVLREIEGLSYKEIAEVTAIPIGTVMSRLSRARERLKALLAGYQQEVCE